MRMATNQSNDVFDPFTSTGLASTVTEGFKDLEEFDPFHIGVPSPKSKKGASTKKSPERKLSGGAVAVSGRASTALPPRLDIKFKVHEEISSTTDQSEENDGSSDIFVEGTVLVRKYDFF